MAVMPNMASSQQIPTHSLPTEWHVASVIVHTRPDALVATREWLTELAESDPGGELKSAEVHADSEQGKLVLVLESTGSQAILDVIDQTSVRAGVLNAALVYHEVIPPEEHPQ